MVKTHSIIYAVILVTAAPGDKLRATQEHEVFDLFNDQQRETYNTIKDRRKAEISDR